MAELEQNRSEAATPFKLQEAKKRGQVPKSLELNSLFAVAALLLVMFLWGRSMLRDQLQLDFEAGHVAHWLAELLRRLLYGVAPLLLLLAAIAIAANFLQTGPIFTT